MNKPNLRENLLKKRKILSPSLQTQKSTAINKNIISTDAFKNATHIATYHAVRGEADPGTLNATVYKNLYLPVITPNTQQGLLFAPFKDNSKFYLNKYSIPEPIYSDNDLILPTALDLVLVPLLGFDKNGNRLGMGGGFYDRTFTFKKEHKNHPPILMGIAYDFQEIEELKPEPWDIPLDYVITESRCLNLRKV